MKLDEDVQHVVMTAIQVGGLGLTEGLSNYKWFNETQFLIGVV